jgi:ABC-type dipeptide/oligopeptide/nickel transport system permease subunit
MSDLRPSLDTPDVAAAEEMVAAETSDAAATRSSRRSPAAMAWRRFRRNKVAVAGSVFLLIMLLLAVFAPLIAQQSPTAVDLGAIRRPPSGEHWLGTDASGRDVFARLLYAARVSLLVGVFAATLAVLLGTVVGAVAGLYGRWVDTLLMRTADMMLSFPPIVIIIVLAGILGPSIPILVLAIAATNWPTPARLVRGVTLTVREREYLHAARVAGASRGWMLRKHIVPAAMGQIVVVGTLLVAQAILAEAVLSFLGLGVQPPQASWGNMLNDAQSLTVIQSMPWLWLPPGLAIAATVLAVNFVGDGLRDAVDPRQSGRS